MSNTSCCGSGLVPSDHAFENLVVNKDLRAQNAAIGKLCALIENGNGAFIGSADLTDIDVGLDTHIFPVGHSSQSATTPATLTSYYYAPVDIQLENFEITFTANTVASYTVSVATTTNVADAPTVVTALEVPIEITVIDEIVHAVAVGPHVIPAGTYLTINVTSSVGDLTAAVTWSLDYHLV